MDPNLSFESTEETRLLPDDTDTDTFPSKPNNYPRRFFKGGVTSCQALSLLSTFLAAVILSVAFPVGLLAVAPHVAQNAAASLNSYSVDNFTILEINPDSMEVNFTLNASFGGLGKWFGVDLAPSEVIMHDENNVEVGRMSLPRVESQSGTIATSVHTLLFYKNATSFAPDYLSNLADGRTPIFYRTHLPISIHLLGSRLGVQPLLERKIYLNDTQFRNFLPRDVYTLAPWLANIIHSLGLTHPLEWLLDPPTVRFSGETKLQASAAVLAGWYAHHTDQIANVKGWIANNSGPTLEVTRQFVGFATAPAHQDVFKNVSTFALSLFTSHYLDVLGYTSMGLDYATLHWTKIGPATTNLIGWLETHGQAMSERIGQLVAWLGSHWSEITPVVHRVYHYAESHWQIISGWFTEVWNWIQANHDALHKIGDGITKFYEENRDLLDRVLNRFTHSFYGGSGKAVEWLSGHIDEVTSQIGNAAKWLDVHWDSFLQSQQAVGQWLRENYDMVSDLIGQWSRYVSSHWMQVTEQTQKAAKFLVENKAGLKYLSQFFADFVPVWRELQKSIAEKMAAHGKKVLETISKVLQVICQSQPEPIRWIVTHGLSLSDFFIGDLGGLKNFLTAIYDTAVAVQNVNATSIYVGAQCDYSKFFKNATSEETDVDKTVNEYLTNSAQVFLDLWMKARVLVIDDVMGRWEAGGATLIIDACKAAGIDLEAIIKQECGAFAAAIFHKLTPESLVKVIVMSQKTTISKNAMKKVISRALRGANFGVMAQKVYSGFVVGIAYIDAIGNALGPHLPMNVTEPVIA